jgi:hypothetical protein
MIDTYMEGWWIDAQEMESRCEEAPCHRKGAGCLQEEAEETSVYALVDRRFELSLVERLLIQRVVQV